MEGLVSIITPTYNSEAFIEQTIESVQNQTYQNWEMIIVDDASTDGTVSIIEKFIEYDKRIQLYKRAVNSGAGVSRNYAITKANGKYIAFLDADDLWKAEKLEKQIHFMQSRNVPFTFSFYGCINQEGKTLNKRVEAPRVLTFRQLFFCNFIGNLTGIYDTKFFGKIAISTIRKRQDWIMWLIVLKKLKKAYVVPESLAFYRVHEKSISASKTDLLKYNFMVYRKHHKCHFITAVFCMIGFLFMQLLVKPLYIKKL